MGIFRIRIQRRTQKNSKFWNPPTQIFLNAFFSKMRGQKYFFDFRFEISVKFRVGWCIRLYDSFRICLRFPANLYLRRCKYIRNMGNIGKSNMNHVVIYIIRCEILNLKSKKYFCLHILEKSRFKNLRDSKFQIFFLSPS